MIKRYQEKCFSKRGVLHNITFKIKYRNDTQQDALQRYFVDRAASDLYELTSIPWSDLDDLEKYLRLEIEFGRMAISAS